MFLLLRNKAKCHEKSQKSALLKEELEKIREQLQNVE
jgi:uncharacterized protein YicC (UPF0701 family)